MDVNQSQSAAMGPPSTSPNGDKSREDHDDANGSGSQPTGAAAAAQQPKVVQTAFIHKLYKFVTSNSRSPIANTDSSSQHARRSEYTTSHLMVKYE